MNQLQAVAMNEGVRGKKGLWSNAGRAQLESFSLAPWAAQRRQDLLELMDQLNPTIEELTTAVKKEAEKMPEVLRLMTHPGVGELTALAFVLIIGTPERFQCGKQIASYLGLIPCEDSSAGHQRLAQQLKLFPAHLEVAHHPARQLPVAFLTGRSRTSCCPFQSRLATSIPAPGHATGTSHRQGGDGAQTRRLLVLDVA